MPYIPRGYARLPDVVKQLIEQVTAAERDAFERESRAYQIRTVHVRAPTKVNGSRMLLEQPPTSSTVVAFTNEQKARVREMNDRVQRIRWLRQRALRAVHQDLGEGDVQAIALLPSGEQVSIPAKAWRTTKGERAIQGGEIIWFAQGKGWPLQGHPFVTDDTIRRWREMLAVDTSSGDSTGMALARRIGRPESVTLNATDVGAATRHVKRRLDVKQERANHWMFERATNAQTAGENLGRDLAIARCQVALNCRRPVAGAAYKGLPDALKRPRGKPTKTPA